MTDPDPSSSTAWGTWATKLFEWQDAAAMGDNGEKPTINIAFDGRWWSVAATSFSDGYAHAADLDLESACREVVERLTSHPERQREDDIESAARALSLVSNISRERARQVVNEAIAAVHLPS